MPVALTFSRLSSPPVTGSDNPAFPSVKIAGNYRSVMTPLHSRLPDVKGVAGVERKGLHLAKAICRGCWNAVVFMNAHEYVLL